MVGKTDMDIKVAVYTGSFDPVTLGHLNVIERGCQLVDQLIIGIGINVEKEELFSPEERLNLVNRVTETLAIEHTVLMLAPPEQAGTFTPV